MLSQNIEEYIGNKIRQRRRLLGMSQTDLGNKIGVTFQQIQKYEKGQNKIMASRLFELCSILGVAINYFYEGFNQESDSNLSLKEESAEFTYAAASEIPGTDAVKLVKIYNKIGSADTKRKLMIFLKSLSNEE